MRLALRKVQVDESTEYDLMEVMQEGEKTP